MRKCFTLVPKCELTGKEILGDISIEQFETKFDKIIQSLSLIKQKLILVQDTELAEDVDFIVDTLLKNQLNQIEITIENKHVTDKEELERMLLLLEEFSNEFYVHRNLEKLQDSIRNRRGSIQKILKLEEEDLTIENEFSLSKEEIFNVRDEIFEKNYNIFNFEEKVGRDNVLLFTSGSIFNKFSLLDKIEISTFINFTREMKNGYRKENPYHNVSIVIILLTLLTFILILLLFN